MNRTHLCPGCWRPVDDVATGRDVPLAYLRDGGDRRWHLICAEEFLTTLVPTAETVAALRWHLWRVCDVKAEYRELGEVSLNYRMGM
jgi:hypothetical protein